MGVFVIENQDIDELDVDELLGLLDRGVNAIYVVEGQTGRIVYVNDRACETTQYDRNELIGSHVSTIEANIQDESVWQSFVDELKEDPQFTIRSVHERKDSSTFPVEVDLDLLELNGRELILTVIRPLQEHKQHQGNLVDTYSQYFPLFKHSPISLWNFDLSDVYHQLLSGVDRPAENLPDDGAIRDHLFTRSRVIEINNSTLELFEAEDKQEILNNLDTILTPSVRDQLVEIFKHLVKKNYNREFEMEPRTVNGDHRSVLANYMVPPNSRRDLTQVFVSMVDITEKKRVQKELEASLEEKKTLLGEIHHRVKNNMQIVASLLKMQIRRLDSETTKKALQESIKRIKSMALIHEKLYQTDRLTDFDLESYLRNLCEHLVDFHSTELDQSDLRIEIESVNFDIDTAIACGLIINELVNNSLEHGLPETKDGRLDIILDELEEDDYCLKVADNGPGWEDETEFEEASQTGLEILDALVRYELNGSFTINASEGFEAKVRFEL